jgi:hypothetical protein
MALQERSDDKELKSFHHHVKLSHNSRAAILHAKAPMSAGAHHATLPYRPWLCTFKGCNEELASASNGRVCKKVRPSTCPQNCFARKHVM